MNRHLAHEQVAASRTRSFNYAKLQAVACIAGSAAVSVGAIYWLIQRVF